MSFIEEYFRDQGYEITMSEGHRGTRYGVAIKGMDSATWNEDGDHLAIKKDARTRTVFGGIVRNVEDLKLIMELVQ